MNKSKIEWCDYTWNPVTGCLHGCEYCYARKIANRFSGWVYSGGMVRANIADDKTYIALTTEEFRSWDCKVYETHDNKIAELEAPYLVNRGNKTTKAPYPFGFMPTLYRYRLEEPARMKKPQNIFVVSMGDLFGEWVPDEWIQEVFAACKAAPQHRYLFLTKNPKRYNEIALTINTRKCRPNWYFGTTITNGNQEFYSSGVTNCFLSIEPIMNRIGNIDLTNIDWVILGAETGNRKDKVVPKREWIDDIVAACDSAGIPVFMKNSLIPIIGEENMRRDMVGGETE